MRGPCRWPGFVGAVSRGCFSIWSNKKTAPHPTWDKSCTPAIPPKLTFEKRPLASRAITRARWITGGYPSASTWVSPFKPPSKVHSPGRAPSRFHHPGLSEKVCCAGYYSSSQVCLLFGCWSYYSVPSPACQALFFNSLKKILERRQRGPPFTGLSAPLPPHFSAQTGGIAVDRPKNPGKQRRLAHIVGNHAVPHRPEAQPPHPHTQEGKQDAHPPHTACLN